MNSLPLLLLTLFYLLLLPSCTHVQQPAEIGKVYKRDLGISTIDVVASGVAVLPMRSSYNIKFTAPFKMNVLVLRTCSREQIFYPNDKEMVVDFVPSEIERVACPLDVYAGSEKNEGAFAWIDLENPEHDLPATMICGEKYQERRGVSVCQGHMGLTQKIKFPVKVGVMMSGGCEYSSDNKDDKTEGREFEYVIGKDECSLLAYEVGGSHRLHRLTIIPYNSYFVR